MTTRAALADVILPATLPSITLLICTLNEEANLPHVLPKIPSFVTEVLVVDGRSSDRTVEVVRELRPDARIVTQPGRGKGDALRYGIEQASGEIIVMLDADGSMDSAEMPRFIAPLLQGYDFVKGSRFTVGGGTADMERHRIFGNWVFKTLTNLLHGTGYSDLCYGYNAFWRDTFARVSFDSDGFEVETQINIRIKKAGLRVVEVPSFESSRINGQGNLRSLGDGWRILTTVFKEKLRR